MRGQGWGSLAFFCVCVGLGRRGVYGMDGILKKKGVGGVLIWGWDWTGGLEFVGGKGDGKESVLSKYVCIPAALWRMLYVTEIEAEENGEEENLQYTFPA